ncbi:MAG: tRNA (adenosine(37)-N6)-threonylcarbamoyltransferase complex dimerization subunit type 1 TsaB [Alphaproteobacteria bacterium]|nr:MAG: tRNA (adenosine(37)-N6)-threonylcarbamoyltransferase complex dimerization subunit type 1 TsaB [Alphaproteobacteria bacterium]
MPPRGGQPPTILAFDSSGPHVAVALHRARALDLRCEATERGQAERLIPLMRAVLAGAGIGWRDLDALAVGTGPGNFTGTRIAVAAARGLALGLGLPAIGISALEAALDPDRPPPGPALASIPAPHGRAIVQPMRAGLPAGPARMIDPAAPPPDLAHGPELLVHGHRAAEIAARLGATAAPPAEGPAVLRIAALAARRLVAHRPGDRPAPVYLRPPDATPPADPPPEHLP